MNGVMNATNDELDGIVSSGERLAGWCALLIVAALVTEAILAFVSLSPLGTKIATFTANSLIAVGVFGELFFHKRSSHAQNESQRRSDLKVAELNERASEAQAETERIKAAFADRRITSEQSRIVTETLRTRKIEGSVSVGYPANDREAMQYAFDIALMLRVAGIKVVSPSNPDLPVGLVLCSRWHNADAKIIDDALVDAGFELHWKCSDDVTGTTLIVGARPAPF
jgi:uncharacterized small protein (DUF1192 family)